MKNQSTLIAPRYFNMFSVIILLISLSLYHLALISVAYGFPLFIFAALLIGSFIFIIDA